MIDKVIQGKTRIRLMTEDEAIEEAFKILRQEITVETGEALEALEPYISDDKYGDLWKGLVLLAPIEVMRAFNP